MSCACGKPNNHCDPCAGQVRVEQQRFTVFTHAKRGTGRTTRMIREMPADTRVVVVHTTPMRYYVERLLHELRPELYANYDQEGPRVVVVRTTRDCDRLRGLRFVVDHAMLEQASDEVRGLLLCLETARRVRARQL